MALTSVPSGQRTLGLFLVTMVMFGITTTLHGLSPLATYGLGAAFFLLLATVGFLVPAGLVAAELATGWPREGGVYVWVSEAFGSHWGFFATWLQWLQNVIFWTVILTGSASMLAIGVGWEAGAHNQWYVALFVVGSIGICTGMTTRGLGFTGGLGTIGSLAGTLLPGVILVGLAAAYLLTGHRSQMSFDPATFFPDLSQPGNLSFAISTIMIFAGIELMGARVPEMRDPGRIFPRAIGLSILLTVVLLIPVVLSIGVLVPPEELNITAGLVQAVQILAQKHAWLGWLPAFFAVALWVDSLGEVGGWMAGTPVSMAAASRDGFLPERLGKRQGETAPVMLLTQAIVGILVSLCFVVVPGVQSVFWVLSALLVQLYVLMYGIMFAAAWHLRRTQPGRVRPFRIPGGWLGISLVCGTGGVLSAVVFFTGFIRPAGLTEISELHYLGTLGCGLVISLGLPVLCLLRQRRNGRRLS